MYVRNSSKKRKYLIVKLFGTRSCDGSLYVCCCRYNGCINSRDVHIRSFLGLVGFYRCFVKDFGSIAAPLNELTKKDVPFVWGDAQKHAFVILKDKLHMLPYSNFLILIRLLSLNVMPVELVWKVCYY